MLGEREGQGDMRRQLVLAIEQGEGCSGQTKRQLPCSSRGAARSAGPTSRVAVSSGVSLGRWPGGSAVEDLLGVTVGGLCFFGGVADCCGADESCDGE